MNVSKYVTRMYDCMYDFLRSGCLAIKFSCSTLTFDLNTSWGLAGLGQQPGYALGTAALGPSAAISLTV